LVGYLSIYKTEIEKTNEIIKNHEKNLSSLSGFEIIVESLIYKMYDVFGRSALLSILYQTGTVPGLAIAERLQEKYNKVEFEILESVEVLLKELKEFYSVQIRDVEEDERKIRFVIKNRCFLRDSYKHREKLKPGKAFCRVNKAYFETAFKKLLGDSIKDVEINFLYDDKENDICKEEVIFYK